MKKVMLCHRKGGSSVVSALASGARGHGFNPRSQRGKVWCLNTLSLVSFAGMKLSKCAILRIRTLTGCPLGMESHPLSGLSHPFLGMGPGPMELGKLGPRSAVGNKSGYRCMSDCRSRGREFDPSRVPYFR